MKDLDPEKNIKTEEEEKFLKIGITKDFEDNDKYYFDNKNFKHENESDEKY